MRWASITDNKTSLTINAWTPSDAHQAMQQQLHHLNDDTIKPMSNQTWAVSKQQEAVDDRGLAEKGIKHLEKIRICVPSASLCGSSPGFTDWWGDPAEQLLSPHDWAKLLIEMSRQWKIKAGKLEVKWDISCTVSVKGLLDALLTEDTQNHLKQLLVEQEGGWREVSIYKDKINIRDVLEWSRRYKGQQRVFKVTFPHLMCSISPGDKALMVQSTDETK